jgi:hypothetical protein
MKPVYVLALLVVPACTVTLVGTARDGGTEPLVDASPTRDARVPPPPPPPDSGPPADTGVDAPAPRSPCEGIDGGFENREAGSCYYKVEVSGSNIFPLDAAAAVCGDGGAILATELPRAAILGDASLNVQTQVKYWTRSTRFGLQGESDGGCVTRAAGDGCCLVLRAQVVARTP